MKISLMSLDFVSSFFLTLWKRWKTKIFLRLSFFSNDNEFDLVQDCFCSIDDKFFDKLFTFTSTKYFTLFDIIFFLGSLMHKNTFSELKCLLPLPPVNEIDHVNHFQLQSVSSSLNSEHTANTFDKISITAHFTCTPSVECNFKDENVDVLAENQETNKSILKSGEIKKDSIVVVLTAIL